MKEEQQKPKDDNEAAQRGQLPEDPAADAKPPIDPKAQPRPKPIGSVLRHALDVMMRRASGEEKPIKTPWEPVNVALRGGLWPGLYTLTSATGMGKTQWAMQCAINAATQFLAEAKATGGKPARVRYIALELGPVDLIARTLGILSRLDFGRLTATTYEGHYPPRWSDLYFGRDKDGKLIPEAIAAVGAAFESVIAEYPIDIETADTIGWNYMDLHRAAESDEGTVRLIVLDYSQLVGSPPHAREELRETVGKVARVGRDLARKHGCAVLALSSTSRANYDDLMKPKEPGKDPEWMAAPEKLIALGKDSGEIEYTADTVMALARRTDEEVHLVIAKGRGLPTRTVPLHFDKSLFRTMDDTDTAFAKQHGMADKTNGKRARVH